MRRGIEYVVTVTDQYGLCQRYIYKTKKDARETIAVLQTIPEYTGYNLRKIEIIESKKFKRGEK